MIFPNYKMDKGITLIEIMVVLTIVGILLTIVGGVISTTRENSRDKSRIADIESLVLAFQLEKEFTGSYPSGTGVEIGIGGSIDNTVRTRIGRVPEDPMASSISYGYYYDAAYGPCGNVPSVYIQAFETGITAPSDCGVYGKILP